MHINTQFLVAHWEKLLKEEVKPDDPLLAVSKGPGPSNAHMWGIHKEVVKQLKKRKLSDDDKVIVLAGLVEYAACLAVSFCSIQCFGRVGSLSRQANVKTVPTEVQHVCLGPDGHVQHAMAERLVAPSPKGRRNQPR
jgi:hypothetical protein